MKGYFFDKIIQGIFMMIMIRKYSFQEKGCVGGCSNECMPGRGFIISAPIIQSIEARARAWGHERYVRCGFRVTNCLLFVPISRLERMY